jgi:hypothetical protein
LGSIRAALRTLSDIPATSRCWPGPGTVDRLEGGRGQRRSRRLSGAGRRAGRVGAGGSAEADEVGPLAGVAGDGGGQAGAGADQPRTASTADSRDQPGGQSSHGLSAICLATSRRTISVQGSAA